MVVLYLMRKGACVLSWAVFILFYVPLTCNAQPQPSPLAVQVSTATELQNAVRADVEHIVVSAHMDLFDLQFSGNAEALLAARGTKTIRVRTRCSNTKLFASANVEYVLYFGIYSKIFDDAAPLALRALTSHRQSRACAGVR